MVVYLLSKKEGSEWFFGQIHDKSIMKYDFVPKLFNGTAQSIKEFAFIWFRDSDMVSVSAAKCRIFIGS